MNKNIESLKLKINKYLELTKKTEESWSLKSATNDLIGFRLKYTGNKRKTLISLKTISEIDKRYRIVDMLNRKYTDDDGYRAIHIYFTKDNFHYQIEIQLWFNEDYDYNFWMHKYLYKQHTIEVSKEMYITYTNGLINSEKDFTYQLNNILTNQQTHYNNTINAGWIKY